MTIQRLKCKIENTHTFINNVRDNFNESYWNECRFWHELPAGMGEFEKGTIILAATSICGESFVSVDNPIQYSLMLYES